ncbi:MAG: hypothetical protein JRN37_00630 [Nitrososphaerota archaeon]|nr:hypothetical protein [Nitrososphaerota archaeon]MDG7040102.1 hypothetical protein [Nitrososphaerota archaeon]
MKLPEVDQLILAGGLAASVAFYMWLAADAHPRFRLYLKSNYGVPFVAAFIVLLVAAAAFESLGTGGIANTLAEYAYFAIVIGVVLQVIASRKNGTDSTPDSQA